MILGIDEVGRGCWAGPLVVGAVVLGGADIEGLTDSKKLSKKKREELFEIIMKEAKGVGLGWVSAGEIDEVGLSMALRIATKRAIQSVTAPFHEIIIDGTVNFLRQTPLEPHVVLMKKADLLVPSVSAASIVAKVSRDNYMSEYHNNNVEYGFAAHVGYGTELHRSAINKFGVTPEHRLSIAPLAKYRNLEVTPKDNRNTTSKTVLTASAIGATGEDVATKELLRRGHEIIVRNWKNKYCEIDIVSKMGGVYYFTEVKHRKNDMSGDGLSAITSKKLEQMRYAAKFYAHVNKLYNTDLRLLAVATSGEEPVIKSFVEI